MAGLLVGLTTRPGDTIVDFDDDPTLAGVAGAHGVRHIPITRPAQLRRLPAGAASLITLRYPRPVTRPGGLAELFGACARLQTTRGSTVVTLVPPAEGPDYATHAAEVIPAAEAAGLGYVEHVIAVTAPIPGQRFTNLATPASRPLPAASTRPDIAASFIPCASSRASPRPRKPTAATSICSSMAAAAFQWPSICRR